MSADKPEEYTDAELDHAIGTVQTQLAEDRETRVFNKELIYGMVSKEILLIKLYAERNKRNSGSLVNTSSDVVSAFSQFKGTMNVGQLNVAQQITIEGIESKLTTMSTEAKNSDSDMRKLVELSEEQLANTRKQLENVEKESKTNRNRFYVTTVIAIIAIFVVIIIAVIRP
jgi:uncharacterized protein (DUF2336 family)